MSWPASTKFGQGRDAKTYGRRGGLSPRKLKWARTPEYTAGYTCGWRACERFYRRALLMQRRSDVAS
jgi:hypothetical protein